MANLTQMIERQDKKLNIETIYRANITHRLTSAHFELLNRNWSHLDPSERPQAFIFNGLHYADRTREILIWILDQLPRTKIDHEDGELIATFANDTDATLFKVKWC